MYNQRVSSGAQVAANVLLDCSGANSVLFELPVGMNLEYLYAAVQTTFNSAAPATVSVYYNPQPGSSSGQILLGVLNFPTASAAPKFFYKPCADNICYAGGEIQFLVTTVATVAGKVYVGFEGGNAPEVPANVPNSVLSL
jgi:hypothetical protein